MDRSKFSRECYIRTGGWLPLNPLVQKAELGDFGQISQGSLRQLGNIRDLPLVALPLVAESSNRPNLSLHEVEIDPGEKSWRLESGVNHMFSSSESVMDNVENRLARSRQVLGFSDRGSFVFHGANPKFRLLSNWSEFAKDLTMLLTQSAFSFRHLYVITHLATLENWTLAIAGGVDAQLEISTELADADYFGHLDHSSLRLEKSSNIDVFLHSREEPAVFFKAKKLAITQAKREAFLEKIISRKEGLSDIEIANWLDTDLINLVESNQLNIATSLDFFEWLDSSLDEAQMLC